MRVTAYQALARGAIEKARYFLAQAEYAERDPNISSARLPYLANLEAAIVSARSTLDHLKSEFASKPGYRQWHDGEWRQLETNSVFNLISERRTWIVHRAAEKVNLTITMHAEMGAYATVTVNATVIRGKPWYKRSLKMESKQTKTSNGKTACKNTSTNAAHPTQRGGWADFLFRRCPVAFEASSGFRG